MSVAAWTRAATACAFVCSPAAALGDEEYVDRLIPGATAEPELVDDGSAGFDPSGAPRALRVESRAQSSVNDQGRESSAWVNLRGVVDTANYGAFSLDASARLLETSSRHRRGSGVSFSLHQRAMPFGGGWSASQGLGVIQTLSPRLAGQQASFFVPTRLVQGASTQWSNERGGLTLQLSGGETGSFSSIGQGSFFVSGNRVAALGIQLQPARAGGVSLLPAGWSYSAVASNASGSGEQAVPGFGVRPGEPEGSGLFQSLRWESSDDFVQGNLIDSRSVWLDGATRSRDVTQRWGLHRLAPGLSWLGSALGGNSQGGYYRWSQIGLRTQIETQVSSTRAVDRSLGSPALSQAGISVRRYIDQQLSVGGVVQLNHAASTALQVSGYSELHRPWAELRLQAGVEADSGRIVGQRLAGDQSWALPIGQRLTTSQALSSNRRDNTSALELAVAGGADVGERLTLDVNARASLPLSSQTARVYNLSASGQWRFARGWSFDAAIGLSRASGLTSPVAVSPIPSLPSAFPSFVLPSTSSRDVWLALRYDFQAGSAAVPIGGRAGAGGGIIDGIVYLDDNRNGRFDALEARAPNVTVVLDGRYTTRTDAQGRFQFPFVAPGAHSVIVVSDTLPLPWVMPSADAVRLELAPRETTRIELGATRDRIGANDE